MSKIPKMPAMPMIVPTEEDKAFDQQVNEQLFRFELLSKVWLLPISELKLGEKQYPRFGLNEETIKMYRLTLSRLPPVRINFDKYMLDGYHTRASYEREGKAKIPVQFSDVANDDVLWESTRLNSAHGLPLKPEEKQDLACRFVDQGKSVKEIAELFGVSENTIRCSWATETLGKLENEENTKLEELYLRCYTEEGIAEKLKLDRVTVHRRIVQNLSSEKMNNPPLSQQIYNLWEFHTLSPEQEQYKGFPGIMPAQVAENVLWYFTQPYDLVIDPMAGSGTVLDVCLSMRRRCLAYDLLPTRPAEIKKHDIVGDGLPKLPQLRKGGRVVKPKLLFLDPPYWKQDETSLANMPLDLFHEAIARIIDESYDYISLDGYVALIVGQSRFEGVAVDHYTEIAKKLKRHWQIKERIIVPYTTQQYSALQVSQAEKGRFVLKHYSDLVILERSTAELLAQSPEHVLGLPD